MTWSQAAAQAITAAAHPHHPPPMQHNNIIRNANHGAGSAVHIGMPPVRTGHGQGPNPAAPAPNNPPPPPTHPANTAPSSVTGGETTPSSRPNRKSYFEYAKATWEGEPDFQLPGGAGTWVVVARPGNPEVRDRGVVYCR